MSLEPGGVVADYAPFYFAPRSPMMYAIKMGNVPTYDGGCDDLVYLTTTVEQLTADCRHVLFTDRNARLDLARFSNDADDLDELVDWELMSATYWNNTADEPDRRERRMAECLVHERVPWTSFDGVVAKNRACAQRASDELGPAAAGVSISVRPDWYF